MVKLALLLAVLLVLGMVTLLVKAKLGNRLGPPTGAGEEPWPYYARKPLSNPEQVLYHRLVSALPDHIILAQVQMSRLLGVKRGFNPQEWNNRINRMSLDFVVCGRDSTVIAGIELDDRSHERAERIAADAKKDKALAAAGVRLLRWNVRAIPDEAAIRRALAAATPVTAAAPTRSRS